MTVCNLLAEKTKDGRKISAWKNYDKFCSVPRFEITISKDGIALETIKTARTTWKKKFNEL